MDTQIRRRLDELVRAIRSSEEYRIFEEAKRSLNEEPDKRKAADAFRRRNFAFQNSEESMSSQAQVDMYHEREKLRRDPLIDEYLQAELIIGNAGQNDAVRGGAEGRPIAADPIRHVIPDILQILHGVSAFPGAALRSAGRFLRLTRCSAFFIAKLRYTIHPFSRRRFPGGIRCSRCGFLNGS